MGLLDEAIREHLELKRRRGADATEVAREEHEALGPASRGPVPLELPPEPADSAAGNGEAAEVAPGAVGEGEASAVGAAEPGAGLPAMGDGDEHLDLEPDGPDAHEVEYPGDATQAFTALDEAEATEPDLGDAHQPPAYEEPGAPHHEPTSHLYEEEASAALDEPTAPGHDAQEEARGAYGYPAAPEHADEAPAVHEHEDEREGGHEGEREHEGHYDHEHERDAAAEHARHADPQTAEHDDVLEETPDFLQETPEHDRLWFEQRPPKDFDFDK
jgi:hypothetical protein